MTKEQQVLNQLGYLRLRKLTNSYFILCKKTYIKPNGNDELLKAGYWYQVRPYFNELYLFSDAWFSLSEEMFVKEHFLSNERKEIWVRLEMMKKKHVKFINALHEEFDKVSKTPVDFILEGSDVRDGTEYRILYGKIHIVDVEKVTRALEPIYKTDAFLLSPYLYELDIDVADTQFYHLNI